MALRVVLDMETGDPDDFITLLLLLGHPAVDLRAVTVTPGTVHQVGLVRRALGWFGRDLPVGAHRLDHPKRCVSSWHDEVFGTSPPSREAVPGGELLREVCDEGTTLITGAPLTNLGAALQAPGFRLGTWVAQGGFAGEGVVPAADQLPKFRGLTTCPTFNLNGDVRAAKRALAAPEVGLRRFVSKNVCHGVVYDRAFHDRLAPVRERSPSLGRIWGAMDDYLRRWPEGKKLHDPLAACCAIDPTIGRWAEVELFRERGEWGARLAPGSGTWIIVGYDADRFFSTFAATG